jgi:hypothetical protein
MKHSLSKHPGGYICQRCGNVYTTKAIASDVDCVRPRIDVKGHDTRGRACTVCYEPVLILRVEVGTLSAVIFTTPYTPDIAISLKDYRRIKPLLHKQTKIVGDDS